MDANTVGICATIATSVIIGSAWVICRVCKMLTVKEAEEKFRTKEECDVILHVNNKKNPYVRNRRSRRGRS